MAVINKCEYDSQTATEILRHKKISFVSKHNGTHLVVFHCDLIVDFWPSAYSN